MKKQNARNFSTHWSAGIGFALLLASGSHCLAASSDESIPGVPASAIKHYQPPIVPSATPANQPPPTMTPTSNQDQYIPGVPAYAIQRYGEPAAPVPQEVPQNPPPVGTANTNIQPLLAPSETPAQPQSSRPAPISQSSPVSVTGPVTPGHMPGFIEMGADYQGVTHNSNWFGEYATGAIKTDDQNVWHAEADNQREFGQTGQYGAIGNTHTFNEDWYSDLTVGAGTNTIFLPRIRVDGFINRKLLDDKNLVATVGLGYYKEHGIHDDKSAFLGATYYFVQPWILEGGIRFNDSSPKSQFSTSQFIAITEGRDKEHFLTLRYGFGREAYEAISATSVAVNLPVQEISLTWRQWLGEDWGFNIRTEGYHNPNYNRIGVTTGIFKEF